MFLFVCLKCVFIFYHVLKVIIQSLGVCCCYFSPFHWYKLFFSFFQWLVKRAIETREEMGDYIRSYSISQFQKTHRLPEVRSSQFFFSITICQMLRYGTSFTALKSAQYTRVAFAIILLFGPRGIHVQIQLGKKLKHYYDREFIDTCLTFA